MSVIPGTSPFHVIKTDRHNMSLDDGSGILYNQVLYLVTNVIKAHNNLPPTTAHSYRKVCQLLTEGQPFTPGALVSSASKTAHHNMILYVESDLNSQTI